MSGDTTNSLSQKTNLQLLKTALLGGTPLTVGDLQAEYFAPAVSRLIDPIALAAQQKDPRYLAAAQAIATRVQQRRQQPLDPGAAALDMLAQRMAGLNLNLSGFRKDPEISYPLAPGVSYQLKKAPSKVGGIGGEVEYISFDDVPMADWDIPSDFHAASNVTVRHLGDVEELVREHLKANPQSSLRLYQTPGGFRAWDLSQRMGPADYAPQSEAMQVDGDYIRLAQQKTPSEASGLTFGGPGFASRISAKPGRAQDWVAQPLITLRGKDSIPDPTSIQLVDTYHDQPIRQHYLQGGHSPAALAMLERQAATASPLLRTALTNARLLGR
jgi:hypothetical protein